MHPKSERTGARLPLNKRAQQSNLNPRSETMNAAVVIEEEAADIAVRVLSEVIQELTDWPEKVEIKKVKFGFSSTVIEIRSDATNFGSLLGAKQAHLLGLKTICKMISDQTGEDIQVSLIEVPGGKRPNRAPFVTDEAWPNKDQVEALFQRLFDVLFDGEAKVVIAMAAGGRTMVEVLISEAKSQKTAEWVQERLQPLVFAILMKHKRPHGWLKIVRDQMLYEQAMAEAVA